MQSPIMILGSSGPIGRTLSGALKAMGHHTVGISRTGKQNDDSEHVKADCCDPEELNCIFDLKQPRFVIDMRAMSVEDTLPLIDVLKHRDLRYTMISSSDVYRSYGHFIGAEDGEHEAGPITERSPLRTSQYPYRPATQELDDPKADWRYDYDKIPAEKCVAAALDDYCILRLPMVFGRDKALARFNWILDPIKKGETTVYVPEGWMEWVTTYGYVKNVGAAIAHCTLHPAATGETINISDLPASSHSAWVRDIKKETGWPGEIVVSNEKAGILTQAISHLDLEVSLDFDGTKLLGKFGFEPPFDRSAALSDCLV